MLTLEHYAAVMAHLSHFKDVRAEIVLAELDVAPELWDRTQEHWQQEIVGEPPAAEMPIGQTFSRIFAATRDRLRAEQPEVHELEPVVEPPKVGQDFSPVDETALGVPAVDESVPFVEESDSLPPPLVDLANLPPAAQGLTQGASAFSAKNRPVMPFRHPRGAGHEELSERFTMAQYASLLAELQTYPEREPEILARYGLSDREARARLEALWARRLAEEPACKTQLEQMVATYRQWLLGEGRSRRSQRNS